MTVPALSPVTSVQVMQALVARELVEGFGLPERQAAGLLGIVPSSVSQYLSGKRLGPQIARYVGNEEARRIARQTAQQLMASSGGSQLVLGAAMALGDLESPGPREGRGGGPDAMPPSLRRGAPRWLRNRIVGEQNAVAECMRLAQRSRDELTRALFRQIAADSLRHAEIVASLTAYLDRGVASSIPTGVTRADVEALIAREHAAEENTGADLGPDLGGVMKILWESMEADERKHELLLQKLLDSGLENGRRALPRSRGRRKKAGTPGSV